jgi:hypothetical protein
MSMERDNDLAMGLESLVAKVSRGLHPSSVPNGKLLFVEGVRSSVFDGILLLYDDRRCGREG